MTVAGIDFNTRTIDIVLLDEDGPRAQWERRHVADARGALFAARNVRRELPKASWWEDRGVHLVGIEDPFSRGKAVAKALGQIAGAIAAMTPPALTIVQTTPLEWKRILTGSPNATKEAIRDNVIGRVGGATLWSQDAYDAYGIAYAVRELCNAAAVKRYGQPARAEITIRECQ